jgi:hypothetical protein
METMAGSVARYVSLGWRHAGGPAPRFVLSFCLLTDGIAR